jgi:hypothetical protein
MLERMAADHRSQERSWSKRTKRKIKDLLDLRPTFGRNAVICFETLVRGAATAQHLSQVVTKREESKLENVDQTVKGLGIRSSKQ